MTITARGVAIICGVLLGGFGALGLLIADKSVAETNFLLASWLMPITLWPAAALAVALDPDLPRSVRGQATALWPAYVGLAVYAAVTGARWLDVSSRGTHERFAAILLIVVMSLHAAVFLVGGGLLALFPKTRPAGLQIWLAYPVLLGGWLLGSSLL
jgi:hypothetical protein